MMNRDRFTLKSNEAVERCVKLADQHGNQELTPLHLAHGIVSDTENIVPEVIKKIGIDINGIISKLEEEVAGLKRLLE